MFQPSTREAVRRLWGRRWVRRVTYGLVAGGAVFTGLPWLASRPEILAWTVRRIDTLVQEETGLPLAIGRIELHPLLGSLVLQEVRLGGDLLTVRRVEVQADLWSLLGPNPHLYAIKLDQPHLVLTEAGLAAIHLKPHPPRKGPLPQVRLDQFTLSEGELRIPQAMGRIPQLQYQFEVKGRGLGPNHLRVEWTGTHLAVHGPDGWKRGRLDLNAEVSEPSLRVHEAYLRLGESQLRLHGHFDPARQAKPDQLEAAFTALVDLDQAARWGGQTRPALTGRLDLVGTLQGTLAKPTWTLTAEGEALRPAQAALLPGSLSLKGSGDLSQARLEGLHWTSPQGDLEAHGSWSRSAPLRAVVHGTNLDLEPLNAAFRLQEWRGVQGQLQVQVEGPLPGTPMDRLDRWQADLALGLTQNNAPAGGLEASLKQGQLALKRLRLDLASLQLEGTASATFGPHGLQRLNGEGRTEVNASQVAQALRAWDVVDLDMEGQTRASAQVRWSRPAGFELDGTAEVDQPRWHGARADRILAHTVAIRGTELRIQDIDLHKEEGSGGGNLWLTWGDTAPGQPQMDMCYTASKLPVAEGLRAADLKDEAGRDLPLTGLGSGWVRLWGPFHQLQMQGAAQVEQGEAYGITIPAASSDFWMDLDRLRLNLSDVRVGERPDRLGRGAVPPEGALALTGRSEMDFQAWTWHVDLEGRVDTHLLALPGPRIQAQVEGRVLGPITSPFGDLDLPDGRLQVSQGRMFFGDRSLEGLQGHLQLARGRLAGSLGMEGLPQPLINLEVQRRGVDLEGQAQIAISSSSARTERLARSLTNDLLEDLSLSATLKGRWRNGRDLTWNGTLDTLAARFNAFELHQAAPSTMQGDQTGARVDIALRGGARAPVAGGSPQAAEVRLSGSLPFSTEAPMAVQVQGGADLAHLKSILDRIMEVDEYSLLSELSVQGTSRFNLLVHGSYFDPLLDGTLSLERGQMNLRGYQGAEDIQAEVVLKDHTLTVAEDKPVQGTLAHGALRASGTASWQLGGLDTYRIKANLAHFQLRDVPDGLDLQGSLQATLEGTDEGGMLKGRLQADRLTYQTEVKLADLILRSALSDSGGLTGLDLDDPLERIRLDLDLDLRSPWSFDTNLLKLEGRTEGPFQVLGTLGHPVPKGTMVFQAGGRVTNIFPAGDMVVDRGSLTFSELRPLDPLISLQGSVTSIPGYTVNLDIRGTLSNLTIVPSSIPSLRQDEIVAILINPGNVANVGTAGSSSGATQGAITTGLASASSGLISTLAFAPFQEQLRRTFGLDRVNVAVRTTTLGNTETEVTLGKSINLLGQRSAFVLSHRKTGELSITSGQVEWRFGNLILQLGASKGAGSGLNPSGEIRHTWSPR